MKAEVEIITPAQAKEYLEHAHPNRHLSQFTVEQYASDMKSGRWENTGQGIIIDPYGKMLDGQHRMHAILLSQQSVAMMVVRGVPAEMFKLIDGGKRRKLSDVLSIEGHSNAIVMGGIARGAFAYIAGASYHYPSTKATLEDFCQRHPNVAKTAASLNGNVGKHCPRIPLGAVLFLANDRENLTTEVNEFVAGVVTGERLWKGDPRLTLREWMAVNRRGRGGARQTTALYFAAIARAWNAFGAGRELHAIHKITAQTRATLPVFGFDPNLYPDVPNIPERQAEVNRSNLEKSRRKAVKPPLVVDTSVKA